MSDCSECQYHPINQRSTGGTQRTDVQQLKQSIRGVCESVDPHELDSDILRAAVNKIYAICCRA